MSYEDKTYKERLMIFANAITSGHDDLTALAHELRLSTIKDVADIVSQVIDANPDKVKQYRSGKTQLLGFFVGQAMKQTEQRADPVLLTQEFRNILDLTN